MMAELVTLVLGFLLCCWVVSFAAFLIDLSKRPSEALIEESSSPRGNNDASRHGIHPRWLKRPWVYLTVPLLFVILLPVLIVCFPVVLFAWIRGR